MCFFPPPCAHLLSSAVVLQLQGTKADHWPQGEAWECASIASCQVKLRLLALGQHYLNQHTTGFLFFSVPQSYQDHSPQGHLDP